MSALSSFDVAGRLRSPATMSEFHLGRAPENKGMHYPADPPRVGALSRASVGGQARRLQPRYVSVLRPAVVTRSG